MKVGIYVILLREDDPLKNTAMKMIRSGFAVEIKRVKSRLRALVLNPYSSEYLGPWHRELALKYGLVVVDASWRKLDESKFRGIGGVHVKLPPLLPGNPVNYAKPCILSSIEAVAASLYILGFGEDYERLLGLYKWMRTFHELNKELLDAYSRASSPSELIKTIIEFWGSDNPCNYALD